MRPYFIHIRPKNVQTNCKGGTTVAVVGDEDNGYSFGVAKCSIRDNYCKATGRVLATGRAFEKRTRIHLPDDVPTLQAAEKHIRSILSV